MSSVSRPPFAQHILSQTDSRRREPTMWLYRRTATTVILTQSRRCLSVKQPSTKWRNRIEALSKFVEEHGVETTISRTQQQLRVWVNQPRGGKAVCIPQEQQESIDHIGSGMIGESTAEKQDPDLLVDTAPLGGLDLDDILRHDEDANTEKDLIPELDDDLDVSLGNPDGNTDSDTEGDTDGDTEGETEECDTDGDTEGEVEDDTEGEPESVRTREKKWEQSYESLRAFFEKEGHLNISRSNKKLFNFSDRQRTLFRQGDLSQKRISLLEAIDFDFQVQLHKWSVHYQKLREFHLVHGHTRVPRTLIHAALCRWVTRQRQHYRLRLSGKATKSDELTDDRIELLEELDFCWNLNDAKWLEHYQELKEHVGTNGIGCKPWQAHLQTWLIRQQHLYQKLKRGDKVSLTPTRLKKLRSLGHCL